MIFFHLTWNLIDLCIADFLNVSGRYNTKELSRDSATLPNDDMEEPFFDPNGNGPRNVSALIGKTAFLSCVVRNMGQAKSVSNDKNWSHYLFF